MPYTAGNPVSKPPPPPLASSSSRAQEEFDSRDETSSIPQRKKNKNLTKSPGTKSSQHMSTSPMKSPRYLAKLQSLSDESQNIKTQREEPSITSYLTKYPRFSAFNTASVCALEIKSRPLSWLFRMIEEIYDDYFHVSVSSSLLLRIGKSTQV